MKYEIEFIHESGERCRNQVRTFGDRDAVDIAKVCFEYGKRGLFIDYAIRKIKGGKENE